MNLTVLSVSQAIAVPSFEILFSAMTLGSGARRLSSAWESTRLKIELSPVQIGEAAFSCDQREQ